MFIIASVYIYRDVFPLATFTRRPVDENKGWLLWSRLALVALTGLVIPLFIPRSYVPVDPLSAPDQLNPEQTACLWSFLTFSYLDPLVITAARSKQLSYENFPPLADYDKSAYLMSQSTPILDPHFHGEDRHLFWSLMREFSLEYTFLSLITVIQCLSGFIAPYALNNLLSYLEDWNHAVIRPWVWALCLFIGPNISSIAYQCYLFFVTRILVHTEAIITQLVFNHALRIRMKENHITEIGNAAATSKKTPLPASAKPQNSQSSNLEGNLNNLITIDLGNIAGKYFVYLALYGPLQFSISVFFLYSILDWSSVVGIAFTALSIPLPGYTAKLLSNLQRERMKRTDARVQFVTEILSVIRMTKLFGWEDKISKQIAEKRNVELVFLRKRKLWNLVNNSLSFIFPLVTMVASFACYTLVQRRDLNVAVVFTSIVIFQQLGSSMHTILTTLPVIINAKISLTRIDDFLKKTDLLDRFTQKQKNNESSQVANAEQNLSPDTIDFRDATFSWTVNEAQATSDSSQQGYRLRIDGELFFQRGKLNLIVGSTGSGKTSLLMALLGEMHFIPNGSDAGYSLPRERGVAYAAQEAWVQNGTVKDNILFGKAFDDDRYRKVIQQCALKPDIDIFEAGDNTEVGEKGLTLSGGQKARITLARAVYSDTEIVILDDIFAALDVHTARLIANECLQGDLLKSRTILLVTHNISLVAPFADFVVHLGLGGTIKSQGAMPDMLRVDKELFKEVIESEAIEIKQVAVIVPMDGPNPKDTKTSKLIIAEDMPVGHVKWRALKLYLSNVGNPLLLTGAVVNLLLSALTTSLSTWFLGYWAGIYSEERSSDVPVASHTIHEGLIASVLGATLRWFDTVPTARIIARCTQDIDAIDGAVPSNLMGVLHISVIILINFAAVVMFVPVFLIPGLVVFLLGVISGQLYIQAQLPVKREMSNRRSPVIAHFRATISGLVSIRAYDAQEAFRLESLSRIDGYTRPARTFHNVSRWIGIRSEAIGSAFTASLAAYLVHTRTFRTPSETGFVLAMAVAFSDKILFWIRLLNEFEVQCNSLERIDSYLNIDQESKPTYEGNPPAHWPASGSLTVENLCARYSADGPEVLHNLSFDIKSGERVGIIGRTGSGKSSLTLSLLRCIPTGGEVFLDGLNTSSVNLNALRSSITIIPQVPELLSGTLRENLDPFTEHSDASLNDALRSAGLFTLQEGGELSSKITLDSPISGGGNNFSIGQRQILALARAILRRSKVLILDEATSAIDYATDSIIQTTLKDVLKNTTLIIVAHRLQTVIDADRILVLDAGEIVEFDSPGNLLKMNGGYLKSLVDESGEQDALYRMVAKAEVLGN
ncbi:P-loop containing nucleoside triphosphate hydrolase protein [Hysterangium stoloniferum]|nr:P-loop containing nucleoside triphosphate hydrolase protein [Hysterangium stoloniferum]